MNALKQKGGKPHNGGWEDDKKNEEKEKMSTPQTMHEQTELNNC